MATIVRILSPTEGISYPLDRRDNVAVSPGANNYGMHVTGFSSRRPLANLGIYNASDLTLNGSGLDDAGYVASLETETGLMWGDRLRVCATIGKAKEMFMRDAAKNPQMFYS
ncbi:MAG: hypothetical protein HY513_04805 [Candidatus Aenigmarchaeota archaeon]|nr:hypothetical protein [Candidatus Aenigmarchaeota archaeon]